MEEWKAIDGYDGIYFISSFGNVKKRECKDREKCQVVERAIKPRKDKDGYCIVTLYDKNRIRKDWKVHRLVAISFIPNPNNYPQVNHKNEIKNCNYVENLEWCSAKYNANYGTRNQRSSLSRRGRSNPYAQGKNNYFYGKRFCGEKSPSAKKVAQYSLEGEYIKTYPCMNEAGRDNGIHGSAISMCCRGLRKRSGGYIWKYA